MNEGRNIEVLREIGQAASKAALAGINDEMLTDAEAAIEVAGVEYTPDGGAQVTLTVTLSLDALLTAQLNLGMVGAVV